MGIVSYTSDRLYIADTITEPLQFHSSLYTALQIFILKSIMTSTKKHIGIMAIVIAVTIAPVFAQSAFAAQANTKVRAFQNDLHIDGSNPGQINTDTDCVGGIDSDEGATYMICYLVPPGVSNNDNSNAIAQITQPTEETECPADVGFNVAQQTCYRAEFAGALFDQQGDWHFHAEFYNAQDQLISDGRQTFANNSFFVLPESPIGVAALVVSSLAVLGGFMFLRGRSHSNLPL
jgi:hypothetical protein